MTTEENARIIAEKIGSYPRPYQTPRPVIVTLDGIEYAGCRYRYDDEQPAREPWQNEPNDWIYFPVSMSTDPVSIAAAYGLARKSIFNRNKHQVYYRFVEEVDFRFVQHEGRIWYVAAHMTWPIEKQFAQFYPFGPSIIMKQISPEMAKAIELTQREKPIKIVEVT